MHLQGVKEAFKKDYLLSVVVTILMFVAMLAPRLGIVDLSVVFLLITGAAAFIFYIPNRTNITLLLHEQLFLFLLSYSILIFSLEGSLNFSEYGQYLFRLLRSILFYVFLMLLYYKFKISLKNILIGIVSVLFINLVITYFQSFNIWGLRKFFVELNTLAPKEMNVAEYTSVVLEGVRSRGLLKGFDVNSITLAGLLFFALFYQSSLGIKFVTILLTFIGTILTARVGLVASVIIIFFYVIHNAIYNRRFLLKLFGIVVVSIACIYLVLPFFPPKSTERFRELFDHSRPLLTRVDSLNDTMTNHMTFKNITSPRIFLFGKASRQHVEFGENILRSDVGYIQLLFNFGVFNLLMIVFIHFWIIYQAKKSGNSSYLIYGYGIVTFLILALKGPYFFSRTIYDLIVLIFFHHAVFMRSKFQMNENLLT